MFHSASLVRQLCLVGVLSLLAASSAQTTTALQELRAAPKPHFRPGHTLPPLTRWGWEMPLEVRIELTEHWGYALEFGGYATAEYVRQLDDPGSVQSRLCALTASDPGRYPLCVLTVHSADDPPDEAWTRDAAGELPDGQKIWSPQAPDSIFRQIGIAIAEPLKRIRQAAPISIILNGGEYALSVYGHHGTYWEKDPRIQAARGQRHWFDYISERKARQEQIISDAVRAAVPDRLLYLYYYTDGCPHRERYPGWWTWAWDYRWMRRVSDLPNTSLYYMHFNSGWTGDNDMLTQALNAVAQQIAAGDPLSYNWVNGGWEREGMGPAAFSDVPRYMGWLKCLYTAGMIGGVAGYFAYPVADNPRCLEQMTALAHVHALFSHLEDFLRHGDLLPGPDMHRWSKDLPAYEFPTGDATARVVARKARERTEWLLTAWAADGEDREVSVTIPDLGPIKLQARAAGSVYRATLNGGQPRLHLMDPDPAYPSRDL